MLTLHENPETAGAKMSALCSFCVHHVAVSGEAVNSNLFSYCSLVPPRGVFVLTLHENPETALPCVPYTVHYIDFQTPAATNCSACAEALSITVWSYPISSRSLIAFLVVALPDFSL